MKFIQKFEHVDDEINLISDILSSEELDFDQSDIGRFSGDIYRGIRIRINVKNNGSHPFLSGFFDRGYSISHLPFSHKKGIINEISNKTPILKRIYSLTGYSICNFYRSYPDYSTMIIDLTKS